MAAKTEPDPPAEPGATAPADERMDRIEATQHEQGGMLKAILDRLPGAPADPAGPGGTEPPASPASGQPADIQATVRAEIAAANKRAADEAAAKGDSDWKASVNDQLEKLRPEQSPRDPQTGFKGRLQRATIGALK
jgi:hypothetical protein